MSIVNNISGRHRSRLVFAITRVTLVALGQAPSHAPFHRVSTEGVRGLVLSLDDDEAVLLYECKRRKACDITNLKCRRRAPRKRERQPTNAATRQNHTPPLPLVVICLHHYCSQENGSTYRKTCCTFCPTFSLLRTRVRRACCIVPFFSIAPSVTPSGNASSSSRRCEPSCQQRIHPRRRNTPTTSVDLISKANATTIRLLPALHVLAPFYSHF